MEYTDGELIAYFPEAIREQYKSYQNITKYMTIGFWAVCLGFAVSCHKIKWLSRLLGDKTWKMFSFKLLSVCLPYYFMEEIMPSAGEEELNLLFERVRDSYKRYKLSGDIL